MYRILRAGSLEALGLLVDELLAEDYLPAGGVSTVTTVNGKLIEVYQAMYKII